MSKNRIIALVVIVIVAVAAYVMIQRMSQDSVSDDQASTTPAANTNTAANNAAPANEVAGSTGTASTAGKLSYTDAVKKYGSNRLQFDAGCQVHPNNVVYKSGTQVMFDNRDKLKRVINFNGTKYTIGAQDYVVIPMTAKTYPATIYPDCDGIPNVVTIRIEK